jgi:hypothetical protein
MAGNAARVVRLCFSHCLKTLPRTIRASIVRRCEAVARRHLSFTRYVSRRARFQNGGPLRRDRDWHVSRARQGAADASGARPLVSLALRSTGALRATSKAPRCRHGGRQAGLAGPIHNAGPRSGCPAVVNGRLRQSAGSVGAPHRCLSSHARTAIREAIAFLEEAVDLQPRSTLLVAS